MVLKQMFFRVLLFSISLSSVLSCPVRELCITAPNENLQSLEEFEELFCGCRHILGPLTIRLESSSPEFQSANFSFLDQLEEVTDYLLFFNVKSPELILPRLRIVGGKSSFSPNFGTQKYSIFFLNCTLGQILFPQLTHIGAHTVGVLDEKDNVSGPDVTKALLDPSSGCNLYGVNWRQLLSITAIVFRTEVQVGVDYSNAVIVDLASECNVSLVESQCEQCLGGVCWNASSCQVLTSTFSGPGCENCNTQSGCYDVTQSLCCDDQCLGGCYGSGPDQCYGCKDKDNNDICIASCPPRFVLNIITFRFEMNPDGKFTLDKFCVDECLGNYIQFEEQCVLRCPEGYTAVIGDSGIQKCELCGSACPRECNGTDVLGTSSEGLGMNNAHLFENCTRVNGHILITALSFSEITANELRYLESVTEITDYLVILDSPANINVFDFLRNLETIQGNTLYSTSSLIMFSNAFEYIDLSGLKSINNGEIKFISNNNLCYLANLTAYRPEAEVNPSDPANYPNNPNCTCDYECQPELRCWGPGPTRCVSCRNFIHERTCVRNCSGIPRVFSNPETKTCTPCSSQCLNSCTDATGFTCDACVNVKSNNECVGFCIEDHYVDEESTCIPCDPLCVMGCTGPNTTLSIGGCNLCNRIVLDNEEIQIGCISGDQCPDSSYFERTQPVTEVVPALNTLTASIDVCRPCHFLCETCNGTGSDDCLSCKYFSRNGVCVETCDADSEYAALMECEECNQECIRCTGSSPSDCVSCKNVNDSGICATNCSDGKYRDSNSNCAPCDASCGTCDAQGMYRCTACNDPNFLTRWDTNNATCTQECYKGFFKRDDMEPECIPCPPLCRTCTSLEDCISCLFARLQNGTCVSECPVNYGLDESGITCTPNNTNSLVDSLDEFKFHIVGAFIAGICIILCTIGIFLACVCIYLKHAKNKIKIDEEQENPTYGLLPIDPTKSVDEVEMNTIGSQQSRGLAGSQESLFEADMTQLVIADLTRIEKRNVLGKGAFGIVYSGVWLPVDGEPVMVAIKELNQDAPIEDMQELIKEAVLLAKMRHRYLVRFYCLCMARQLMVVNELVQGGSLLDYLKKQGDSLTPKMKLTFMQQIASGMNYLETRRLVHRDLASRNCLVDSTELVKISDFGMSRILDVGEDQYISSGGKIPVRWMPLESIFYKQYSHKSDVWSYGITIWEILTSAKRPYGNVKPQQVIEFLVSGGRLEQPTNCSTILYQLLNRCWIDKPDDRICFAELSDKLQEMLKEPHLYVYGEPGHEFRSESSDSSVMADYEEIDEEVMAYLVTTQVQVLVRDAINGKRGTLNYENLREKNKRTGENSAAFSGHPSHKPVQTKGSQPDRANEYSLAQDMSLPCAVIHNTSAEGAPLIDYMLASDLAGASNEQFNGSGIQLDSNRTSKAGSDYILSNDMYVAESKVDSTVTKISNLKAEVHTNPYTVLKDEQNTNYLTTTARITPSGYLATNPSLERANPSEYLASNPNTERPAPSGYLATNPSLERAPPTEYLASNPNTERPAPSGYLATNPSLERAPPTEYLASNPNTERPAPSGYLATNPSLERAPPTEYLASNPNTERPAPSGYLATNPSLERTPPTEYLASNPNTERPAPSGYLATNPSLERAPPTEYLASNPNTERPAPSGYLATNPSLERAPPTEYLDSIPEMQSRDGNSNVATLYESLDPKTMENNKTEYVNQERIDSKRSSPQKKKLNIQNSEYLKPRDPDTIVMDDSQYMELDANPKKELIDSLAGQASNREEIHEYEDIDDDIPPIAHEYSEPDEIIPKNSLDNTRLRQADSNNSPSPYEYIRENNLTSNLSELASFSQSPHYVTSIANKVSNISTFSLEENNPIYNSVKNSSK